MRLRLARKALARPGIHRRLTLLTALARIARFDVTKARRERRFRAILYAAMEPMADAIFAHLERGSMFARLLTITED